MVGFTIPVYLIPLQVDMVFPETSDFLNSQRSLLGIFHLHVVTHSVDASQVKLKESPSFATSIDVSGISLAHLIPESK